MVSQSWWLRSARVKGTSLSSAFRFDWVLLRSRTSLELVWFPGCRVGRRFPIYSDSDSAEALLEIRLESVPESEFRGSTLPTQDFALLLIDQAAPDLRPSPSFPSSKVDVGVGRH